MARFKDVNWGVSTKTDGNVWDTAGAQLAVLMDLRDELKRLNHIICCPNFIGIPSVLEQIRRNTTKPRRRKVTK